MFCDDKDKNDAGFRMSVESYGCKATFESAYPDEKLDSILDGFLGLMISVGWSPKTIIAGMDEYVQTNKSLLNYSSDIEKEE